MAEVAEKGMQETMQMTRAWALVIAKILEYIARRKENRDKTAGIRDLAKCIREGHGVSNFAIQGKGMAEMVKAELLRKGIPYFETGPDSILIKNIDLDKVKETNRSCLITRCNYYQVVGADEMENAIARNAKIKDKGVTEITGLSFYEMECLKHKCNDISKGFTVGVKGTEDGTYDILIRSNKIYEYDPKRTDFCEASSRFIMSLYGPNSQTKIKQIEDDAKTDKLIAGLKNNDKEHWLVSADDPSRYVHFYPIKDDENNLLKTRFEYCERYPGKDKNGKFVMLSKTLNTRDSDEADYEVELVRATDRIKNKAIINDQTEFEEHLSTLERTVNPDRTEKSEYQAHIAMGERELTDKINVMIKTSFDDKERSPVEMFRRYREDFCKIMEFLQQGKVPDGFAEKDMEELQAIVEKRDMNLNDYTMALEKYKQMEISGRDARVMSKDKVQASRNETDSALRKDKLDRSEEEKDNNPSKDRDSEERSM